LPKFSHQQKHTTSCLLLRLGEILDRQRAKSDAT
jgi:hypothetical protein